MSDLLFFDESGHDRRNSPYEVIAGVALKDRDIWTLICELQGAEARFFGRRITPGTMELKAPSPLKKKPFRLAAQMDAIPGEERAALARQCLEKGDNARTTGSDGSGTTRGELTALDRAQAHILVDQIGYYFRETAKGRMRAPLIISEPFFVHSHMTTAIQLADLVAYIIAWGVRIGQMDRPARSELQSLAEKVCELQFRAWREGGGNNYAPWSFAVIEDLRPREERAGGDPKMEKGLASANADKASSRNTGVTPGSLQDATSTRQPGPRRRRSRGREWAAPPRSRARRTAYPGNCARRSSPITVPARVERFCPQRGSAGRPGRHLKTKTIQIAIGHINVARNMMDVIAGLRVLAQFDSPEREEGLKAFYEKCKDDPLVTDNRLRRPPSATTASKARTASWSIRRSIAGARTASVH